MFKIVCVFLLVATIDSISANSKKCGVNEIYLKCGPRCSQTCDPRDYNPADKCSRGCFCIEGYVRYKGVCRDAKVVCCPKNEIFACGSACQNECAKLGEVCPILNKKCVENCFCIDGYARDENGKCIRESKCPPKPCNENEHFDPSAKIFEPSCDEPTPSECGCGKGCGLKCGCGGNKYEAKCVCDDGYVRDQNRKCIKKCDCKVCKENEVYEECGNPCQGTCDTPIPPKYCILICRPGCYCKEGYLLDVANEKCVKPCDCV